MRRAKGVSAIIATALLILIIVALAAAIWLYMQRFTQAGAATANLVVNRYIDGIQNIVVDLAITNKHNTRLQLVQIRLVGAGPGGTGVNPVPTSPATTTFATANNIAFIGGTYDIIFSPALGGGEAWIEPREVKHFTITLRRTGGQPPSELGFQVVLRDDAGNLYTIQSNTLKIG